MKRKVSELEGAKLDSAVALALGGRLSEDKQHWDWPVGAQRGVCAPHGGYFSDRREHWHPAADWSLGGPIIERERIELTNTEGGWYAAVNPWSYLRPKVIAACPPDSEGPTPLIAAMRAFVISTLGEEVELP